MLLCCWRIYKRKCGNDFKKKRATQRGVADRAPIHCHRGQLLLFILLYVLQQPGLLYITCISHKKSFISLHQKILYNNNLGAQSLNSKRGNSQREQQQIHDFPVSRKHYSLSLSLLHLSLFILDLHRSAWSLQQHIANSYSRAQRVSNSSRESKTIENGPNKNRRRRIIQEVCAFAALDDSQLRSLIACWHFPVMCAAPLYTHLYRERLYIYRLICKTYI
jgi:hypothetical protein